MPTKPLSHEARQAKTKQQQYNREYYLRRKQQKGSAQDAKNIRSSARWQRVRMIKLTQQSTCEDPFKHHPDRPILAKQVDHIVPLQDGGAAFAMENLQSLCTHCHAIKSQQERN